MAQLYNAVNSVLSEVHVLYIKKMVLCQLSVYKLVSNYTEKHVPTGYSQRCSLCVEISAKN